MPAIKGTSSVADSRALSKALKQTKFPANFSVAVDVSKINRPVLTQWIENKITRMLGFEDDIVASTAINLFLPQAPEDAPTTFQVDPRTAQIDMCGFLGDEGGATFAEELWTLLLEAQESPLGIPKTLLEEKKKEMAAAAAKQQSAVPPRGRQNAGNHYNKNINRHENNRRWDRGERAADRSRPISPPRGEQRRHRSNYNNMNDHEQYDEFGRPLDLRSRDRLDRGARPADRSTGRPISPPRGEQLRHRSYNNNTNEQQYDEFGRPYQQPGLLQNQRQHTHQRRFVQDDRARNDRRSSRERPERDSRRRPRRSSSSSSSSRNPASRTRRRQSRSSSSESSRRRGR
jgi:serine/arginine repetitive matrix protein 1